MFFFSLCSFSTSSQYRAQLYNGREVENTANIKRLLEESNTHGKIMTTIANSSRKDGERMKMIAIISILYAPGAYFSVSCHNV
jgi:hypothetical protein